MDHTIIISDSDSDGEGDKKGKRGSGSEFVKAPTRRIPLKEESQDTINDFFNLNPSRHIVAPKRIPPKEESRDPTNNPSRPIVTTKRIAPVSVASSSSSSSSSSSGSGEKTPKRGKTVPDDTIDLTISSSSEDDEDDEDPDEWKNIIKSRSENMLRVYENHGREALAKMPANLIELTKKLFYSTELDDMEKMVDCVFSKAAGTQDAFSERMQKFVDVHAPLLRALADVIIKGKSESWSFNVYLHRARSVDQHLFSLRNPVCTHIIMLRLDYLLSETLSNFRGGFLAEFGLFLFCMQLVDGRGVGPYTLLNLPDQDLEEFLKFEIRRSFSVSTGHHMEFDRKMDGAISPMVSECALEMINTISSLCLSGGVDADFKVTYRDFRHFKLLKTTKGDLKETYRKIFSLTGIPWDDKKDAEERRWDSESFIIPLKLKDTAKWINFAQEVFGKQHVGKQIGLYTKLVCFGLVRLAFERGK